MRHMTRVQRLFTATLLVVVMSASGRAADQYGSGVSLATATPLAQLLESPAAFEGRTVRIDGTVTAVCEHMGCWMSFTADGVPAGQTFLVKVDDGVIVFPVTAKGRRASAQGVIERVPGNPEAQSAANEHAQHAAGAGAPAPAPVAWQLKATGAIVHE
jgi:hypothetical protein